MKGFDPSVSLVIPAKGLARAKTRLGLSDELRRRTAYRLLRRTVATSIASLRVGAVFVVTDDRRIACAAEWEGATLVHEQAGDGLNRAAYLGRQHALAHRPHSPVAVLVADLPLLGLADLDKALEQFSSRREPLMVVDHLGVGTTMLVHCARDSRPYLFGPGSARAHAAAGYRPAEGTLTSLRFDLDTPHDLAALRNAASPERPADSVLLS